MIEFLTKQAADTPATGTSVGGTRSGRLWVLVVLAVSAWVLPMLILFAANSRLLPSWHGFLHSAIATRFPTSGLPPEDPFFAGEKLPYYWFYHWFGSLVARALQVDYLHAFQLITLASLASFVAFAALTGTRLYNSRAAGLLIGYLGLVAGGVLGPLVALAKHLASGATLWQPVHGNVPDVFVSNALADSLFTHPVLGAMYVGADWRIGANLVWFNDISARGPALACLMGLLYALVAVRRSWPVGLIIILLSGLTTALNPVIGLAATACICGAFVLTLVLGRFGLWNIDSAIQRRVLLALVACGVGTALAAPTFLHLFSYGNGTTAVTPLRTIPLKLGAIAFSSGPLALLAIYGVLSAGAEAKSFTFAFALAGFAFLAATVLIVLDEGNQHNFANAAQVFLAVPAVAWLPARANSTRLVRLLWLIFLPGTLFTLSAYAGRPGLPLEFANSTLRRTPADSPLNRLYDWIRSATATDAIFVIDPGQPVKMSGNASELPAFTGRTLFTDQPGYLTTPFADAKQRMGIATRATQGQGLSVDDRAYLRRFGRPVYIISYHADVKELATRLEAEHGKAVFADRWIAVFRLGGT